MMNNYDAVMIAEGAIEVDEDKGDREKDRNTI